MVIFHDIWNIQKIKYKIKVRGKVKKEKIDEIIGKMIINNIKYNIINAELISHSQSNSWLTIEIAEGKNREVRKIFEHLDIQINRLIRIKFGPFELGQINKGEFIELNKKEVPTKLKKIGFKE
jgi:23S rRNA pseudouridine2605 synthase